MTDKQKAKVRSARKKWRKRNEVAYSFAMEVCNQHETAKTIAALYSGTSAKGLIERLRERFENVEKNTIQSEISKFNSMHILPQQSSAEYVDDIERQARVLEDLGQQVKDDDKLTRLKEGLTDSRYAQLAHSLYTTPDLTFKQASSLIKGYENTAFGKLALKNTSVSEARDGNEANNTEWGNHMKQIRCSRCRKRGHYAKKCTVPQHVVDKMKHKFNKRKSHDRGDRHTKHTSCEACGKDNHSTRDCRVLKAYRQEFSKKRSAENTDKYKGSQREKSKLRVLDSDDSGSESNILVDGSAMHVETTNELIYLDCGCNKVVLRTREHMTNMHKVNITMRTADKRGCLRIIATGEVGNMKDVYHAPDANKNLICMQALTANGYKVTFEGDEVIIMKDDTNEEILRSKSENGLYPLNISMIENLLKSSSIPSANVGEANLGSGTTENKVQLWHRRLGHEHEGKIFEPDRTGIVSGINLDQKYFRKKYKKMKKNKCLQYLRQE
jgi:hypothetical protein